MTPVFTFNHIQAPQTFNQHHNPTLRNQFQTQAVPVFLNQPPPLLAKRPSPYEFTDAGSPAKHIKGDPISIVPVAFLQNSQQFLPLKKSIADKLRQVSTIGQLDQLRPITDKTIFPKSQTVQFTGAHNSSKFNLIKTSIRKYCVNTENAGVLQSFPTMTPNAFPIGENGHTSRVPSSPNANPVFFHNSSRQWIIQVIHEEVQEEEALQILNAIPHDVLQKYNLIPLTNNGYCPRTSLQDQSMPPIEIFPCGVTEENVMEVKVKDFKDKYSTQTGRIKDTISEPRINVLDNSQREDGQNKKEDTLYIPPLETTSTFRKSKTSSRVIMKASTVGMNSQKAKKPFSSKETA